MREELQQSCKEESPSLSLAFSLLHLWKTQQHTRENAAVFFLNPTASSGHIGFSSRNTRNKRILICFLMCWNPPHRTDIAKHAAHVRHAQGIIIVGGIRIEICKDFLGFHAAHHLWSSHNCQAFRTIDRWSQQKRASYCKVQKCSGFLPLVHWIQLAGRFVGVCQMQNIIAHVCLSGVQSSVLCFVFFFLISLYLSAALFTRTISSLKTWIPSSTQPCFVWWIKHQGLRTTLYKSCLVLMLYHLSVRLQIDWNSEQPCHLRFA